MPKQIILDCETDFSLTITEVINTYHTSEKLIKEMITEGIINVDLKNKNVIFGPKECLYIKTVTRLNHDLGVNTAGAAIILELLRRLERN